MKQIHFSIKVTKQYGFFHSLTVQHDNDDENKLRMQLSMAVTGVRFADIVVYVLKYPLFIVDFLHPVRYRYVSFNARKKNRVLM